MAPVNDLSQLDVDEVSPVRRGAIGKIWAFLKSNDDGDLELSKATVDAMGTPVDGEEALVAKYEEDGLDESAIEANLVIARLEKTAKPNFAAIDANEAANDAGADNANGNDADDDNALTQDQIVKDGTPVYTQKLPGKKRPKFISSGSDDKDALADVDIADPPPLSKSATETGGGNDNNEKERGMGDSPSVPVQKDDGTWDLSGVAPDARPFYDAVLKSRDDAVAEGKALAERVEKAEAASAELEDKLVEKEIVAKAESEFSHIAKADELMPVLKDARSTMSAENYEKLTELLKSASAKISEGALFAELGRSTDSVIKDAVNRGLDYAKSGGNAWEQIEAGAASLVEKSDDENFTQTHAIDKFLKTKDGQRLYADYMAEQYGVVA